MQVPTQNLREELSKVAPRSGCCAAVELATLLGAAAMRHPSADGSRTVFMLRSPMLARRALALMRREGADDVELRRPGAPGATGTKTGGRGRRIELAVGEAGLTELVRHERPPWRVILKACGRRKCCILAHLRALVLARGHLSNPRRAYHVEVSLPPDYPVARLTGLAFARSLCLLVAERRGRPVLYLKEREAIAGFLGQIGAVEALLGFEDAAISRRMREGINRTVNCEVSNLRRASRAATDQLAAIATLRQRNLLDTLKPALRDAAQLRLAHPDEDLASLARRTHGKIGRSGIFHRLREIVGLVRALRTPADKAKPPARRGRRALSRS